MQFFPFSAGQKLFPGRKMRWSNLRWGEILPGWDVSIHVQMIWYYKMNYTILPRSHSGETSHQSGMILVIQEAPKRLLTWDETSHRSGISHLSRIAAEWWISFIKIIRLYENGFTSSRWDLTEVEWFFSM